MAFSKIAFFQLKKKKSGHYFYVCIFIEFSILYGMLKCHKTVAHL